MHLIGIVVFSNKTGELYQVFSTRYSSARTYLHRIKVLSKRLGSDVRYEAVIEQDSIKEFVPIIGYENLKSVIKDAMKRKIK